MYWNFIHTIPYRWGLYLNIYHDNSIWADWYWIFFQVFALRLVSVVSVSHIRPWIYISVVALRQVSIQPSPGYRTWANLYSMLIPVMSLGCGFIEAALCIGSSTKHVTLLVYILGKALLCKKCHSIMLNAHMWSLNTWSVRGISIHQTYVWKSQTAFAITQKLFFRGGGREIKADFPHENESLLYSLFWWSYLQNLPLM